MTPRKPDPDCVTLLAKILTDLPNRAGAPCIGHWVLYDAIADGTATPRHRAAADTLCRHCPHSTTCPDSRATRPQQERTA